jgi:hypothetical protein
MNDEQWTPRPIRQRGRRSAPTNRQTADQLAALRAGAKVIAARAQAEDQARDPAVEAMLRKAREDAQR